MNLTLTLSLFAMLLRVNPFRHHFKPIFVSIQSALQNTLTNFDSKFCLNVAHVGYNK